ncbi:MAG: hypothetical protein N2203_03720 [Bacteroidia bacterium]|nr:hypothetical protein [Bacteroidia bacterium]
MKYHFKIRFNTHYQETNNLYWRVLINDEEHLFSDVLIKNKEVKTITHTLPSGEQKWSIYCESDYYYIDENNKIIIE